jgi:metallophosphoesterase superfamily enzyme
LPYKVITQIHDAAIKENISDIIFLGDFFHNRKEISLKALNTGIQCADLLNKFNTHFIIGNHDI